jgi:hypothetical protein
MCLLLYCPLGRKKEITLNGLIIRTSTLFSCCLLYCMDLLWKHRTANSGLSYLPICWSIIIIPTWMIILKRIIQFRVNKISSIILFPFVMVTISRRISNLNLHFRNRSYIALQLNRSILFIL